MKKRLFQIPFKPTFGMDKKSPLCTRFVSSQKNKLFYNHAEKLLPNSSFHLGTDGFWAHHYQKPHAAFREMSKNRETDIAMLQKEAEIGFS